MLSKLQLPAATRCLVMAFNSFQPFFREREKGQWHWIQDESHAIITDRVSLNWFTKPVVIWAPCWLQMCPPPWLPDGYSQIFRLYLFGPSGWKDYGYSATLRSKIWSLPFLGLRRGGGYESAWIKFSHLATLLSSLFLPRGKLSQGPYGGLHSCPPPCCLD